MSDEFTKPPIHFSLTTWATDKTTGKIPAVITPSIYLTPEQIDEFKKGGIFDKAYKAFRGFVLDNNPNLELIGEKA